MSSSLQSKRICVTGGGGFLGRAVCSRLEQIGAKDVFIPRRREFDLTRADAVERMFDAAKPDIVIHLAAEVGYLFIAGRSHSVIGQYNRNGEGWTRLEWRI